MSEVQPSATAIPSEPVDVTASEATTDPIRTNATKDLTPESRPEVTEDAADTAPGTSTTETPATDGATEGTSKGTAVVESQPINEGFLNYRAPGLVKSLIPSKKFFWFSDEPVEHKHLTEYVRSEKASDMAHPNAAHATQTGKGLLFFAKRAEDKPQPQGILNLADVTDVVRGGINDITFKLNGHKHAFQTSNKAERDGWIVAIETRQADAKVSRGSITDSEGYKSALEKFAKPTIAATAAGTSRSRSRPKKATETKVAESKATESATPAAAAGTGAGDSASSSDEGKAAKSKSKSRSQSRKRSSMFGALLGKKEQHDEKKEIKKEEKELKKEEKEEKKEVKKEEKAEKAEIKKEEKSEKKADYEELKEEKKAAKNDGVANPTPLDAAAIASRVMGDPVLPAQGSKTDESPAGDVASPAATSEGPTGTATRESAPKANKRNSIFGFFGTKKESTASPAHATTETAPAVPAKDEPSPVSPTAPQLEDPTKEAAPTVDTTAPVTSTENAPETTTTTSPVSADATKTNRRSSFFSNLGTKKEKKTGATSDAEGTDGEGKKSGGFGGLLRKASRAQGPKSTSKTTPVTDGAAESETTAPTSKEAPAAETTTNGEASTEPPTNAAAETAPENATANTQQTPIQAAA